MRRDDIKKELSKVFKETFKKELELYDEMTASDVDNWDSLSHMILISNIEKNFSIKFKLRELNKMKNVGVLLDLLTEKLNQ